MRREKTLQLAAALVFILMAGMAALPFWLHRSVSGVLGQLRAEQAVQQQLTGVLAGLRDAAVAQRSFLVTGNDVFLQPYLQAWQRLPAQLRATHEAARTGPQRETAQRVAQLAGQELADLDDAIALRRREGAGAAGAALEASQDRPYLDELRRLVGAESAQSDARRARLTAELLAASNRASAAGVAATVVNLGVLVTLLFVLLRRLRERQETVRRLDEHAGVLTVAVEQAGRRNHELALIAEMLRAIDALASSRDAGPAIVRCFSRLLPGRAGTVFLRRDGEDELTRLAQWGAASDHPRQIPLDACNETPQHQLCIPLVTHEALVGLLHLEHLPVDGARREQQQLLAVGAAEQLALALANAQQREALHRQSMVDPLTGLYNRRYFDEALHRELARARRKSAPTSLVVLDIDHFKLVNDTYGHGTGDDVLRAIAQQVRSAIREGDVACRYGGEELVVLIPECPADVAAVRAEGLRAAIEACIPETGGAGPQRVTASIGVAAYPTHGLDPAALFRAADKALYRAKRQGRNRVVAAGEPA